MTWTSCPGSPPAVTPTPARRRRSGPWASGLTATSWTSASAAGAPPGCSPTLPAPTSASTSPPEMLDLARARFPGRDLREGNAVDLARAVRRGVRPGGLQLQRPGRARPPRPRCGAGRDGPGDPARGPGAVLQPQPRRRQLRRAAVAGRRRPAQPAGPLPPRVRRAAPRQRGARDAELPPHPARRSRTVVAGAGGRCGRTSSGSSSTSRPSEETVAEAACGRARGDRGVRRRRQRDRPRHDAQPTRTTCTSSAGRTDAVVAVTRAAAPAMCRVAGWSHGRRTGAPDPARRELGARPVRRGPSRRPRVRGGRGDRPLDRAGQEHRLLHGHQRRGRHRRHGPRRVPPGPRGGAAPVRRDRRRRRGGVPRPARRGPGVRRRPARGDHRGGPPAPPRDRRHRQLP